MAVAAGGFGPAAAAAPGSAGGHYAGISRQRHDTTCGLASLATLMRAWGGDERATEDALLRSWKASGGYRAASLRSGLSRSDLADVTEAWGAPFVRGRWIPVDPADISKLARPVVVLIRPPGSRSGHFVVLRGVHEGKALIADPILGHLAEPLDRFLSSWAEAEGTRGLVFLVDRIDGLARASSPLRLPGDKGAVERHVSPREAALRRQTMLPRGTSVWSLALTRRQVGESGESGDTAAAEQSLGMDLQSGLSDKFTLHLGAEAGGSKAAFAAAGGAAARIGGSWLAREERDSGRPALVLSGGLAYALGDRRLSLTLGARLERNRKNSAFSASLAAERTVMSGIPGTGRDHSITALAAYTLAPGRNLSLSTNIGLAAGTGGGSRYVTPVAEIGLSYGIGRDAVLSVGAASLFGAERIRTVAIGIALVR